MRRRDRPPPRTGTSEKDVLLGFLDYLRAGVAAKVDGVPEPRVRRPGVPSGTNLLGLVNHLTHVERATLLGERVTNWQATFHADPHATVDDVVAAYRDATTRANEVVRDAELDVPLAAKGPSPRWALTHLIEETGRHAGHADILRELIDGATGR